MKYRALAFDLDGTLVDSKIDFAAIRSALGLGHQEPILEALVDWPKEKREAALEVVHYHEQVGARESTPIHGALDFIASVRARGLRCAIFTRNSRETAHWSLEKHQIPFDHLIAREDAAPKPEPDGLLEIARIFEVKPSELLFVGDYRFDLEAGLRAGTPTALYLPTPADFPTEGAHFSFGSYADLGRWFFA